ncbi:(S)-ureidoglycine aminohydrolase [Marchantia polymorpha subsp. ruderalis]|uniref:Cupin type-2 domain-containing protein n=1 Tax=Marchantia polymorpha TaxID=3197 RepID=A0A2R6WND0_MARPO|nr:hypothetical protein MARPO_0072s0097 [Marchantia polymorpha]BBN03284.1 hypothetical protein Mp_2g22300 [Marchantia polymorpha subsp. ruderalis]|eukprot:PTQ35364.1 hypothetical protein MARPO_0072s0097 [Marchantia polymorpha]
MKIFHSMLLLLLLGVWLRPSNSDFVSADSCPDRDDVELNQAFGGINHLKPKDAQNKYIKVVEPTLAPIHLYDLPGYTRSVYERDYALITPESQVFSPISGWINSLAAFLITPAMGSHFSMYFVKFQGNSSAAQPSKGVERFVFVVDGQIQLSCEGQNHLIQADGYAYVPPGTIHEIRSDGSSMLLIYERRYSNEVGLKPELIVGVTDVQPLLDTPGEVFELRKLLPTNGVYDFNIHIMDFQPGEYLNVKEVHYNQHGLLLLEGRGIYRLGKDWHPVQAGDVIWMAPYVPQWYAALGRTRSRYIIYKDVNRDPLLHPH